MKLPSALRGMVIRSGNDGVLYGLIAVTGFDYADRTLVGAVGPSLLVGFHLSNATLGLLATVVSVTVAAASVPVGILTDKVPRVPILAVSLALWTGAMVVAGAATVYLLLLASRALLGFVTASVGPVIPSLVGDIVPSRLRSRAMAFVNTGQLLGTGAAYILAAIATGFLSFRWGFWLLAIGSGLAALHFFRAREPERKPASAESHAVGSKAGVVAAVREKHIPPNSKAVLAERPAGAGLIVAARYALRVRTDIVMIVARSVADYFFAGIGTFAIVFATEQYGVSEQQADLAVLVVGVGAALGIFTFAWVADQAVRRRLIIARPRLASCAFLLASLVLLPAILTTSIWIAIPVLFVAAFLLTGSGPVLDAIRIDVLLPELRGRSESIRGVVKTAAEGIAPVAFGVLSGVLAGGGRAGLQLAFLLTLPAIALAGIILLMAASTYGADVAAVLESERVHSGS